MASDEATGQGEISHHPDARAAFITHTDTVQFREQSIPRVRQRLSGVLTELTPAVAQKQPKQLGEVLLRGSDTIARAVLGASQDQDIKAPQNSGLIDTAGEVIWFRPENVEGLETELTEELSSRFSRGEIDAQRLANGMYLLRIMVHKYINGNGRVARSERKLIEKATTGIDLTEEETRKILIKEEGSTQLTRSKRDASNINFGIVHFAMDKGYMTNDEISQSILKHQTRLENVFEELSQKTGIDRPQLRKDFIRYLVVESSLHGYDFEPFETAETGGESEVTKPQTSRPEGPARERARKWLQKVKRGHPPQNQ